MSTLAAFLMLLVLNNIDAQLFNDWAPANTFMLPRGAFRAASDDFNRPVYIGR